MDFLILGPIDVRSASGAVSLGNKPKAVLAVLLLHANEPVSAERLALAVWGEDAPGAAVANVHQNVSRLRRALGDADVVSTAPAGYCLRVGRGELDADRFEGLVEDARRALGDGRPEDAATILREALGLWRGPALAEFALEPFAKSEADRLQEQRLAALELRVEADLLAGRHAEVVGELQRLVADHPTREGLAGRLMLALYRCGRQAEALAAYTAVRSKLVDELGVEPGPQLRELQAAILAQDASLQPQPMGATELPEALDAAAAPPLVGRDDELAWLLERWDSARRGTGALIALTGPRGIGKRRLVAELASTIRGPGVAIVHAAGRRGAEATIAALRATSEARRPMLVVVEDADSSGRLVQDELARIGPALADAPVLVVACAADGLALAHLRAQQTLELAALDVRSVRAIASGYAPSGSIEVPADWLLQASDGVPSRVHEAAGKWARREAARRVDAAAERAEAGREELRCIEAELTGGVVTLQETRDREPVRGGGDRPPIVCPYKGLASYDVSDAPYFFGRRGFVAELISRLVGSPLLGVVGPSGSGKSSLMRAGLLPALAQGMLPGSADWPQVLLRPGVHPMHELATGLAAVEQGGRIVLAIDQFEETFTVCEDENERAEFISEIVQAAQDRDRRWVIVLALRADHYGRCTDYPQLASLLAASNVLVRPMQADELREAIEKPAQLAGLRIEPELVAALVADVEQQPGALPLMSTALLELWQRRSGRRMRHVSYAETGGIQGAVSRLAEDAFAQLDEAQQQIARGVLMRLVGSSDGDVVERRRVTLGELEIERNEDVARVVALLADRRLLTISAGSVELAHEAVLREWPRLRGWIEEDHDGLRIQRGVSVAAAEWERLGRDDGVLYRGTRLSEAAEWRELRKPVLNALEREFLGASELGREHERVTRRRRTALLAGSGGVVILAIVVVAVITLLTNRERDIVASRDIAGRAAAIAASDSVAALAAALAALDRHDTEQARNAVRQATLENNALAVLTADKGTVYAVSPSADGKLVATAGTDGAARIWSLERRRVIATVKGAGRSARAVSISRDARHVVIGYVASVWIADIDGRHSRMLLKLAGDGNEARSVDISADGSTAAIGTSNGEVRLVDVNGKGRTGMLGRHADRVTSVAFDRDGSRLVSASDDGTARVWNLRASTSLSVGSGAKMYGADFSRDGASLATADAKGRVSIWDPATGARVQPAFVAGDSTFSVRFSDDGGRVVTTGEDGGVIVSDVSTGNVVAELRGHSGATQDARFAGDRIVSVGEDGTLRIWSALAASASGHPGSGPTFSPDGQQVVSGDFEGGVWLWDPKKPGSEHPLGKPEPGPSVARFSADGDQVISAWDSGGVRLYDLGGGAARDVPAGGTAKYAAAVDRTGTRVATGGVGSTILLQAPDGSDRRILRGHKGDIYALAFSDDGKHLVSGSEDGTARIWNAANGDFERNLTGHEQAVESVDFDADAARVVTAGDDGTARVWPVDGGDPVILFGHDGRVSSAQFNARGDRVVTAGVDGTVRVWDSRGGEALVRLKAYDDEFAHAADFSSDGRVVSSGGTGTSATSMTAVPCPVCGSMDDVLALADARAPHKLTPDERRRLLGEGD